MLCFRLLYATVLMSVVMCESVCVCVGVCACVCVCVVVVIVHWHCVQRNLDV